MGNIVDFGREQKLRQPSGQPQVWCQTTAKSELQTGLVGLVYRVDFKVRAVCSRNTYPISVAPGHGPATPFSAKMQENAKRRLSDLLGRSFGAAADRGAVAGRGRYVCTYTHTYIHTYIHTYVCMYVCMYVHTYIRIMR